MLSARGAWVIEPAAEIRSEYDDNIRLESPEQDAIATSASAQATVRSLSERSEIAGAVGVGFVNYGSYGGERELEDSHEAFLNLSAQRSMERSSFGIELQGRRDDLLRRVRLANDLQLEEGDLPDPELVVDPNDVDAETVSQQVDRTLIRVSPNLERRLGERTSARLNYSFYQATYDQDRGDLLGAVDMRGHSIAGSINRAITERDRASVEIGATRFDPDDFIDAHLYEVTTGWNRRVSERLNTSLEIGVRRAGNDIVERSGWLFRFRAVRRSLSGQLRASLERSVVPDAYGDLVEADRASLNYERRLSERWLYRIKAGAFRTDSLIRATSNRDAASLSAEIQWALSSSVWLGLEYRYRWVDRDQDRDSQQSNAIVLALAYRPPSRF